MSRSLEYDAPVTREPLEKAIQSRGFTPARRELPDLLALLARDREVAELAVQAMIRTEGARAFAEERFAHAEPPVRARLLEVVAATTGAEATPALIVALDDADPRTRRVAIRHLGRSDLHMQDTRIEAALLALLDRLGPEASPEDVRAVMMALGKVGGERARARMEALAPSGDSAHNRVRSRALLQLARTVERTDEDAFDEDAILAAPVPVVLRCRAGLESLLAREIAMAGARVRRARVEIDYAVDVTPLVRSRLALSIGFPLPSPPGATLSADAVADALTSPHARAVFEGFTIGRPRFRLAWAEGGHKRALVWKIAELVAERSRGWPRPLVNDPTKSVWEVTVGHDEAVLAIEASPKDALDGRFAYRAEDVPAASHPTIAAALALLGGVEAGDVVWDPFVGSGTELVERARLGPYARLVGTDIEASALRAARANTTAAGLGRLELELADALAFDPGPVSLVITNPPLGRRVRRDSGLKNTLVEFFVQAGRRLAPGGRLVWVCPHPELVRVRAGEAGLELERSYTVDMGGFDCALERWNKRA